MAKKTAPNRFQEYHDFLKINDNPKFHRTMAAICENLGIASKTYYRKLSNPEGLSIAEKIAIAVVYDLPVHFIFPELEPVNA